jgi:cell division cycle 2-like protein
MLVSAPANLRVKDLSDTRRSGTPSSLPGTKKYSRFDSSPEPESDHEHTPPLQLLAERVSEDEQSDKEYEQTVVESDVEMDENVQVTKNYEDLTEEEKLLLTPEQLKEKEKDYQRRLIALLPVYYPGIYGCRSINEFKLVNHISEGTFGVVYRAREWNTDEFVALKQLKMEKEKEGFPITSLREINMLMKCRRHPNVVGLREIVTDSTGDKIYMVMEFVEHDLRALMKQLEARKKRFTLGKLLAKL